VAWHRLRFIEACFEDFERVASGCPTKSSSLAVSSIRERS